MRSAVLAFIVDLVVLATLIAGLNVVLLAGVHAAKLDGSASARFELRDGRVVEAHSPEEVEALRARYRGQISRGVEKPASRVNESVMFALGMAIPGLTFIAYVALRDRRKFPHWFRIRRRDVTLGLLGAGFALAANGLYGWVLSVLDVEVEYRFAEYLDSSLSVAMAVLAVGIIAPVGEELYMRGRFFDLISRIGSPAVAIVATTLLFAMLHWRLAGVPFYLAFGLVAGWFRHKTGRLTASTLAHVVNNCIGVLLMV